MGGDPGTVPSPQTKSVERNDHDGAAPRGKGARTLFPEAVSVVPIVGRSCRSKQPGTDKKPGTYGQEAWYGVKILLAALVWGVWCGW